MNKGYVLGLGVATVILGSMIVSYDKDTQTTQGILTKAPEASSPAQVIKESGNKNTEYPRASSTREQKAFPEIGSVHKPNDKVAASSQIIETVFIDELLAIFEDGIVLDNNQKVALDIFISRLPSKLSEVELNQILAQIQESSEDSLAHQLVDTLERLYKLKQAEDQFIQSVHPPSNLEEMHKISTKLGLLRQQILGEALNEIFYPQEQSGEFQQSSLLSSSETNSQTTPPENSSQMLDQWLRELLNEGLADNEIERRITEKYGEKTASSLKKIQAVEDEWLERYLKFYEEKQYIMQAGLSEDDKAEQAQALLKVHYSPQEFKGAEAFDKLMTDN